MIVTIPLLAAVLTRLRDRKPLVHVITSAVAAPFSANALLALGASPAMVESPEEAGDFTALADALLINLGQLTEPKRQAMSAAVDRAATWRKPWVLDPVGVGGLRHRTDVAGAFAARRPTVLRGNASEILALAGEGFGGKGVDAVDGSDAAVGAARALARRLSTTVAVTGAVDYVADGDRLVVLDNGHPSLRLIVGSGCAAGALIAACLAVESDPVIAAAAGLAFAALAGELAAPRSRGPGSLAAETLDALHGLDAAQLAKHLRLR